MNRLFLIFIFATTLSSCYYDNEEYLYGILDCDIGEVSYTNQISPVIANTCATTKCHDGTEVSFKTYEQVKTNMQIIKTKINNGSMPPSKSKQLTAEELQLINCWIDAGGKNN